jgi:hypothetical protein
MVDGENERTILLAQYLLLLVLSASTLSPTMARTRGRQN